MCKMPKSSNGLIINLAAVKSAEESSHQLKKKAILINYKLNKRSREKSTEESANKIEL